MTLLREGAEPSVKAFFFVSGWSIVNDDRKRGKERKSI